MAEATTSTLRQATVAEAKAALREHAARSDEETFRPLAKHVAMVGAGLAVASVVFGKQRTVGAIVSTALRVVPGILKFL